MSSIPATSLPAKSSLFTNEETLSMRLSSCIEGQKRLKRSVNEDLLVEWSEAQELFYDSICLLKESILENESIGEFTQEADALSDASLLEQLQTLASGLEKVHQKATSSSGKEIIKTDYKSFAYAKKAAFIACIPSKIPSS